MGGASSYIAMLCIAGFLGATWIATKVSKAAGVSDIVLVITTGVVFGPDIIGLISKEYTVCEHTRHVECHDKDLAFKVANDIPLGEHLGRIVGMDLCHQEDYHHDDHHGEHGDGHGEDHGDVHGMIGTHNASHNASMHGNSSDLPHSDAAMHNFTEVDHSVDLSHNDGHVRRLAGGGNYHSYEECLEKSCEADISTQCQLTPDVFTLIGHAGVALMIFESGMHFDFEKAKVVGPKACVVAVLGTILPLITGTLLTIAYGKGFFPQGVSAGTALAPTSVGIALRLLGEAGVLQENFGQAIITAAFVDDILSLVLFNVLFSLGGAFDFIKVVVFPVVGIVFMLIAMYGAMTFWPKFIHGWLLPKIPEKEGAKVSRKDEVLFFVMIALLLVYGTITHFLGTHLWGCFIAGMSFACLDPAHPDHAHHVWVKQTKRMTGWMIRIFFACTVAFSIPLDKLLSLDALWKGSIMGIGPCILTKVCCAPFMGDARWVIGWAMVGRAEFAYLIAQMAAAGNMLDEEMFSVVIWSLLWATIFAPFIFRFVLNRYVRRLKLENPMTEMVDETDSRDGDTAADHEYKLKMKSLDDIKISTADVEAPASRGPITTDPSGSHRAALPNSDCSDPSRCCTPFGRSSVL
eukprot:TRINITY_DN10312_c1_g1_i1.p1 TRINITY_DN10312_c1_g1~~TRINITY_DN10312_c1_g1_i1.p1  ORF type:complete len:664 (+),score=114.15 TRINITY_DN10312_c1_g1_i1:98-1993(+)